MVACSVLEVAAHLLQTAIIRITVGSVAQNLWRFVSRRLRLSVELLSVTDSRFKIAVFLLVVVSGIHQLGELLSLSLPHFVRTVVVNELIYCEITSSHSDND